MVACELTPMLRYGHALDVPLGGSKRPPNGTEAAAAKRLAAKEMNLLLLPPIFLSIIPGLFPLLSPVAIACATDLVHPHVPIRLPDGSSQSCPLFCQ